jgi:hypothetical protein
MLYGIDSLYSFTCHHGLISQSDNIVGTGREPCASRNLTIIKSYDWVHHLNINFMAPGDC